MTDKVISIKEIELPPGKFIYGTVARLTPQKNLSVLLQAFAKMPNHFREESLLCIVGSGELEENLKQEALELGIDKEVIWVPRSQNVKQYYEQMDLFILPSNYEGFGLVLLEAMECGVPIIGANNSAIAEVLADDSGRLFETGNAEDLSNSMMDLREEFFLLHYQSAGKDRLNFFSPNVMSHKVDEAYKRALNRR
jgi:glycosyltransferase involved in cell wall biosynthesis